jgi:hypothetical protein
MAKPWARQRLGHRAGPPQKSQSPVDCDLVMGGQPYGQAMGQPSHSPVI